MNFIDYQIAHSPDADDIFMYYAIKFGWVSTGDLRLENHALDIETLNQEALKNTFDATAISFALYPKIKSEYALLRTATSFGDGYGPKLIAKKTTKLKKNFTLALSGEHTTNAMIAKLSYPNARVIYKNFLEIEQAVLDGEADAGVLIHESILDFDASLRVEAHIFDLWKDLVREDLPLPLGAMAIRRSLPITRAIELEEILTKAVALAVHHKGLLSKMLMERNLVRVDEHNLDTYLDLYANDTSITMNDLQLKATQRLFDIGAQHKLFDALSVQDCLIPTQYMQLRQS
ncbi:MAG: succinate--CoA ligase [Deltaproteobacteria bacterium]|nr:MAG: succinate--CoA ligase [Deltaproteobacteria bacterium]